MSHKINNVMSGERNEVQKIKPIFWPFNLLPGLTHIGKDKTKPVCFYKKNLFNEKKFRNFIFKIFAVTMKLHCNGKNLKS